MAEPAKPRAKEGGVLAGIAALIREVGEIVSASGGIIVVLVGVGAVVTITSASLGTVPDSEKATVATAALGVLGTIVGAYFGLRVGQRGKEAADEERRVATAKVERLAASADPQAATQILDDVNRQAAEAPASPSDGDI